MGRKRFIISVSVACLDRKVPEDKGLCTGVATEMNKTVLIVEDDAALRTRCRKFLEWERLEVLVAADENAAFSVLEENRFDVDLVLVGVSRHTQRRLDRLKAHLPDATFLLLSNDPDSADDHTTSTVSRNVFYPESLVPKVKRLLAPKDEPELWRSA
jgi:CheY-like chemotaxis protein